MTKKSPKHILRAGLTLTAALVAAFAVTNVAVGSHYAGYHWGQASGLHLIDFVNSSSGWGADSAAATWNCCTTHENVISQNPCASGYHCVPVHDANYGNNGWLGLTTINYDPSTSHINTASIQFNDYYNPTATARQHTSCQEEGHAQGLAHLNTASSCMNDTTLTYTSPVQHDYDELNTIYNHNP